MQQTSDFDAAGLTRSLLRRSRQGALAHTHGRRGDPYCSLVNVASRVDGAPILLISRLAVHTKNILADDRVSLMLDERAAGDPLEGARIMLSGHAEEPDADDLGAGAQTLFECPICPLKPLWTLKDFFFAVIRPTVHPVAGFGRIIDLKPEQFLIPIADARALMEAEQGAIEHMNADHREALNLDDAAVGSGRCGLALHRMRPLRA